jgi:hypothetical protein
MSSHPDAPQKLDDLSMMVGEMRSTMENLKGYVHDFRHDENNRRQADQGFQDRLLNAVEKLRKDIQDDRIRDRAEAAAERLADRAEATAERARDRAAIAAVQAEVDALKSVNQRREGMVGAVDWVLKSPLIGWLVGLGTALWAVMTGRLHL